jgi:hypothetical protein
MAMVLADARRILAPNGPTHAITVRRHDDRHVRLLHGTRGRDSACAERPRAGSAWGSNSSPWTEHRDGGDARSPWTPQTLRFKLTHYRGVNLRPERERPRLRVFTAIALTAFCLYTAFVVVHALVLVAEGARDRWQFWAVLLVICCIGVWAGIVALRKWRRIAAQRGSSSN